MDKYILSKEQKILSDIIVFSKYAKFIPELNRRETWEEIIDRNKFMHISKYPHLKDKINDIYNQFVLTKRLLPSMRSLQFAGKPIDINPTRIYNCSYVPVDSIDVFSEIMFLLLSGCGVGYSIQRHHIEKLPPIKKPNNNSKKRYLIGDSIEGWADAVKILIKSYFKGGPKIEFDFRDIRPKGALLLTSGGKAPGPGPLRTVLAKIEGILESKNDGDYLSSIEIHDIICHIADGVLAGGIRRAALISLFSFDDNEMFSSKFGNWWELNSQRARANNSIVLLRHKITESDFYNIWEKISLSPYGEPGLFFTNDKDYGTNPCGEISLRPNQFCNLVEINGSMIDSQEEFNEVARAASFVATLQAGYTNFHYLRSIWKRNTEKDSLIGVSITGLANEKLLSLNFKEAAKEVLLENEITAKEIGINPAARTTTVKPSGTASLVLGTSSGIHAWYDKYYIRRIRVNKNESIYKFLKENNPEILVDDYFKPYDTAIIEIPIKAPESAITRNEDTIDFLERIKKINLEWIRPGHRKGENYNNVSATVYVKENEWDRIGKWVWENHKYWNGITFLPHDGGKYIQAPFEEITKEEYENKIKVLKSIDLSQIKENEERESFTAELACSGGSCEINSL